jgi:hypothetical protein
MVLVEKHAECKSWLSVYYAGHDWKMINSFEVTDAFDVQDAKWILNDTHILVQDSFLEC